MAGIDSAVLERHGIKPDEYERILQLMGREPNLLELGLFSVMWSEHCSYKSSRVHLKTLPTTGTLVVVPAYGEVKHANDQAVVTLAIEEQDKDKADAASRVNTKMKQGLEIVKKADPQARLKTQGYYTYPVYPDEPAPVPGQPRKARSKIFLEL